MKARKTIFDLERRCDLLTEYEQIVTDLRNTYIQNANMIFTLGLCIRTWPHRQGAISIDSYANSHGFSALDDTSEVDALYSLELLLNLLHWAPPNEKLSAGPFDVNFGEASQLEKECTRCIENIEYFLTHINMRVREKNVAPFPQYAISKRDAQVDAVIEAVPDLSEALLSYLDIRNQNDMGVKEAVLKAIADYLEDRHRENYYKGTMYAGLERDIFTVFNNVDIRHSGQKQWKLRKPERMKLYDQTFKAAVHLLQMEDVKSFNVTVSDLKKKQAKADETKGNTMN